MNTCKAINDMGHFVLQDAIGRTISNPEMYKIIMNDIITNVDNTGFVSYSVKGGLREKIYTLFNTEVKVDFRGLF